MIVTDDDAESMVYLAEDAQLMGYGETDTNGLGRRGDA